MTFLNNFFVSKSIQKLFGDLREGVCPSLWFQYELLTPLELGERSIPVRKFLFGKTEICMCYDCPTLFHGVTVNFQYRILANSLPYQHSIIILSQALTYAPCDTRLIMCNLLIVSRRILIAFVRTRDKKS